VQPHHYEQIEIFFLPCFLYLFLITACKKESNQSGGSNDVKYEILTSTTIAPPSLGQIYRVGYVNGTGQLETADNFIPGQKSWTKSITITTSSRPLNVQVAAPQAIFLSAPGSVTLNIYVGGVLKATTTSNSSNASGMNIAISNPCYYIIN
jgi:hypothetical protein